MIVALSLSPSHLISLCFFCTSVRASFAPCCSSSLNSSLDTLWCFSLQVRLAHHQICQNFLCFDQVLHFLLERQAVPLQHYQAFQLFLSPRHTSDGDLVLSLSEVRKQLFAFLISCWPRNSHNIDPWFVWRQNLFHQFSRADLRDFALLQLLYHFLCNSFTSLIPIMIVLVVSILHVPSCSFFLRHPLPLTLMPSLSACN